MRRDAGARLDFLFDWLQLTDARPGQRRAVRRQRHIRPIERSEQPCTRRCVAGRPVNPRTDYTEWKRVLVAAAVREARLHDARQTAATVLLVRGVPDRVVMDMMGWSNTAMAKRYLHITANVRKDVARRLDGLIWDQASDDDDQADPGPGTPAKV
jgi:integrase